MRCGYYLLLDGVPGHYKGHCAQLVCDYARVKNKYERATMARQEVSDSYSSMVRVWIHEDLAVVYLPVLALRFLVAVLVLRYSGSGLLSHSPSDFSFAHLKPAQVQSRYTQQLLHSAPGMNSWPSPLPTITLNKFHHMRKLSTLKLLNLGWRYA